MTAEAIPPGLAGCCPQIRSAGPADAVAGQLPRFVAAPASTRQVSAVLAAAAGLGLAVLPRGAGTHLGWGAPPVRCDLVIDTRRMDQVLEHAAGDLVARLQAGVLLDQLAAVLGQAGQRLAVDPAEPGTVGGLVASGAAGPLRFRFGTPRDLLIGITVVLADGTVAKAGGKVVKNVAGYDLGKLFAGSRGTLGVITEAVFRLHPRPAAAAYVTLDCPDPASAQAVMAAAAASPLAPSAAEIDQPRRGAPIAAGVLVEGESAGVAERAARLRDLLAGAVPATAAGTAAVRAAAADASPAPRISATAPPWWGRGAAEPGGTVLQLAFWAGQLGTVLGAVAELAAAAGLDPAVGGSGGAGVLHAAIPAVAPAPAVADFVTGLRAVLSDGDPSSGARGSVVVLHAPPEVAGYLDLWGPVPGLALMHAIKDQFDPGHRMAPGRFAGGI